MDRAAGISGRGDEAPARRNGRVAVGTAGHSEFVAQISPSGEHIDFTVPMTHETDFASIGDVGAGPDGSSVWFSMRSRNAVGRIDLHNATTTTLTSSAPVANERDAVTFTARVDAPFRQDTPTGSVVFSDGSTSLGPPAALVNGVAHVTATLPPGRHRIKASYTGDGPFRASEAAMRQRVRIAMTIDARPVIIGVSPAGPSLFLPLVMLVADIAPAFPGLTIDMVDSAGRIVCQPQTSREQPSRVSCDPLFNPDGLVRVIAGGGFTAILHENDEHTGAQDHAGLAEIESS